MKFQVAVVSDDNFDNANQLKHWLDTTVLLDPKGVEFAAIGAEELVKAYAEKRKDASFTAEKIKAEVVVFFWDGLDESVQAMFKTMYEKSKKDFILVMYEYNEVFDRDAVTSGEFTRFYKETL